jgi:hypothetical protein
MQNGPSSTSGQAQAMDGETEPAGDVAGMWDPTFYPSPSSLPTRSCSASLHRTAAIWPVPGQSHREVGQNPSNSRLSPGDGLDR